MKKTYFRLASGAVLGLLAMAGSGALSAANAPSGTHGAMDTAQQQQRLDALHPANDGVPPGVDPVAWANIYVPADNQQTPDRIALGRKLYFDTRLSRDGTVSLLDVSRRKPRVYRSSQRVRRYRR